MPTLALLALITVAANSCGGTAAGHADGLWEGDSAADSPVGPDTEGDGATDVDAADAGDADADLDAALDTGEELPADSSDEAEVRSEAWADVTMPPACTDPAFWILPADRTLDAIVIDEVCVPVVQPLFEFRLDVWWAITAPPVVRSCWRVAESTDSGWTVGDVAQAGGPFPGLVGRMYGDDSFLVFDFRIVAVDGTITAGRAEVHCVGAADSVADISEPLRGLGDRGTYAAGDRITFEGGAVRDVPGLVAAAQHRWLTAWVERPGAAASMVVLRREWSTPSGPAFAPLAGDGDVRLAVSNVNDMGDAHVAAVVGTEGTAFAVPNPWAGTVALVPAGTFALAAPADELVVTDDLVFAQVGGAIVVHEVGSGASLPVAADLATGVDALVPDFAGDPWVSDGVSLTALLRDASGAIVRSPSGALVVSSGLGTPLLVRRDGWLVGTAGLSAPPDLPGPWFVDSTTLFGGSIAAAVVDEGGPGDLTFAVAEASAGHRIYVTEKYWRGCD